jgi:hypothetical protein
MAKSTQKLIADETDREKKKEENTGRKDHN